MINLYGWRKEINNTGSRPCVEIKHGLKEINYTGLINLWYTLHKSMFIFIRSSLFCVCIPLSTLFISSIIDFSIQGRHQSPRYIHFCGGVRTLLNLKKKKWINFEAVYYPLYPFFPSSSPSSSTGSVFPCYQCVRSKVGLVSAVFRSTVEQYKFPSSASMFSYVCLLQGMV